MRSLRAGRRARATDLVIIDPAQHTVIDADGAVRSVQAAVITLPESALEEMWSPVYLERLGRTYWGFLSKATLGLIRVTYAPEQRSVVLIAPQLVLLRFRAPEYTLGRDHGVVRWRIRDGLLVARHGHERDGYLEIDVRRRPSPDPGHARVYVKVTVANFYPALASWFTQGFYRATQSEIHVLVTHGFLRSLASLELERSAVGRFERPHAERLPQPARRARSRRTLAAVAAATAAAILVGLRARR